jgi:acylpyruvate hydrolase
MAAKVVRFAEAGQVNLRPGLLIGNTVADISGRHPTIASFLGNCPDGWDPELSLPNGAPTFDSAAVRFGPPMDPGNLVYAVGANYRKHAEEAGLSVPKTPVIFFKPYTSLVGPNEAICIPPVSTKLDYEGEMAVMIGKEATGISRAQARAHVAAITILNDTTARDLQWVELGSNRIVDWFTSKALDKSSPLGPHLTSAKEIADVHNIRIKTSLNGQTMQDANTSMMVYDTWALIEFITRHATLRPGDIIATGTPFGVGGFREIFLNHGDTVRIELEGIGVLENPVTRSAGTRST